MRPVKKRPSVKIDTVPLPDKVFKMKTAKGKVSKAGEKYYVTVGRRRTEIPVGTFVSKAEIGKLAGKEVFVTYAKGSTSGIVAIGTWPTPERKLIKKIIITCYIPIPDFYTKIGVDMRYALLNSMVKAKIITLELSRQAKIGIKG